VRPPLGSCSPPALVHDERPVGLLHLEQDEPVPAAVGLGF
jgi:hypothetical protein